MEGEFRSTLDGELTEETSPSVKKKTMVELVIFLILFAVLLIILLPWATPRIRYMLNNDYYKVIPGEDFGFCFDEQEQVDVFRTKRCSVGRCTESFFDDTGELIKAYNYDEGSNTGSEERFTNCEYTNYFFFEKFAPSNL